MSLKMKVRNVLSTGPKNNWGNQLCQKLTQAIAWSKLVLYSLFIQNTPSEAVLSTRLEKGVNLSTIFSSSKMSINP